MTMSDLKEQLAETKILGVDLPDAVTIAGGVGNALAVEHLNTPEGVVATTLTLSTDLFDGRLARFLGIANSPRLDKYVDRAKELNTSRGMVREGVLPAELPVAGYTLRAVSKLRPDRDNTLLGESAMNIKDVAFMCALGSLLFPEESDARRRLSGTAQGLGWISVALGTANLLAK